MLTLSQFFSGLFIKIIYGDLFEGTGLQPLSIYYIYRQALLVTLTKNIRHEKFLLIPYRLPDQP